MNTTEGTSATAVGGSALSEGLGPPPNAGTLICWRAGEQVCTMEQAREYAARATAIERSRIAALIAQHSGLTLETLEYLETMRQGPTPDEWAELDRAARA